MTTSVTTKKRESQRDSLVYKCGQIEYIDRSRKYEFCTDTHRLNHAMAQNRHCCTHISFVFVRTSSAHRASFFVLCVITGLRCVSHCYCLIRTSEYQHTTVKRSVYPDNLKFFCTQRELTFQTLIHAHKQQSYSLCQFCCELVYE